MKRIVVGLFLLAAAVAAYAQATKPADTLGIGDAVRVTVYQQTDLTTDARITEGLRPSRRSDQRQHGERDSDQGTTEHAHFSSRSRSAVRQPMRRFRGRLDSGGTKPIFAHADLCAEMADCTRWETRR